MAASGNIYEFSAWAKIQSSKMALKYVKGINVGKNMDHLKDKLLLLESYIKLFDQYQFAGCSDFVFKGKKHLNCDEVILSKKNSLFLGSEERKTKISSDYLNCVSIKDLCVLAKKIQAACATC